jgi:hypothetical protein
MLSFITLGALIAAMVLSVVLGFIWYGPLFGKTWMLLNGMVMPDPKPGMRRMFQPTLLSFMSAIFITFVLGFSIAIHNAFYLTTGLVPGLSIAFLMWLGFIVPVYLNLSGWEGKPWKLFFINTGYWFVFMMLTAVLITVLV